MDWKMLEITLVIEFEWLIKQLWQSSTNFSHEAVKVIFIWINNECFIF